MLDINKLRKANHSIISIGLHFPILQSMLDFDYLSGKKEPTLKAIISTGRKYLRLFFGDQEVLIPVYSSLEELPPKLIREITLFLNLSSARRVLSSTVDVINTFPNLIGGTIFAEDVPEKHSLELYEFIQNRDLFITGPSSIGVLIPNVLKLGAIGGTEAQQLIDSQLFQIGNVAVLSSSGGMTNELIRLTSQLGKHLSFSLSFGGDRFPVLTPVEAFLAAEKDKQTKYIVYFGELGGYDEYDLADLIKQKKVKKQVIAYIGGTISEMFETPPQFGHAKAMASRGEETAQAKAEVLRKAGAKVTNSFTEMIELIKGITNDELEITNDLVDKRLQEIKNRQSPLFISSISRDKGGSVEILGEDMLSQANNHSYGHIVASMLLGTRIQSKKLAEFTELVLKLLVDHGPYVSGVVNTMISARAGRDLVSSVASGILTIGPRFGGPISKAAEHWFEGVNSNIEPYEYVEQIAKRRERISGIGHRKYRIDYPDPRVKEILSFVETHHDASLQYPKYTSFALELEKITTAKKGNLILNVDGALAAVLLDLLAEEEGYTEEQLKELIQIDFFNAFFVIARTVGFTAHFLDQKRKDEGLFRLSPKEVGYVENS